MITFVIPTLNAQEYLTRCLSSIRNQTEKAQIIIVDGGSTDETLNIAKAYKCKVLDNPLKLAEFGVQRGILATNTQWVVVFAADNELPHREWLKGLLTHLSVQGDYKAFTLGPSAVWGKIRGDEMLINQYFGLIQNDPLSWFINKNLYKEYLWAFNSRKPSHWFWNIFVDPNKPLIWGANGLVYKTKHIKPIWDKQGYVGDNDAFQTLIENPRTNWVIYYDGDFVIHHHCKSIRHCVTKWWRNHTKHYLPYQKTRNMRWLGKGFYAKVVLWCIYTPLFSFPHSVYLALRDKNKAWLYHFPLSMAQMLIFIIARFR